jgi:hypothetical protein
MRYPEISVDEKEILKLEPQRLVGLRINKYGQIELPSGSCLQIRNEGNLEGLAIYLSNEYDYVLGEDNAGQLVLVPLRRGGT